MFSKSQFDAINEFSGGGFMPSQSSQPADYQSSSSARSRDSQGLVPVTVKMISEASHLGDDKSKFMINGLEVSNVTLVGLVFDKEERASDVNFILDDGTGRNNVKDGQARFLTQRKWRPYNGIYVRLVGLLKSFQGKKQLVAFSVRPVKNFDEITYHYIDCITFQLRNLNLQVQGVSTTQPQIVDSSLNTPAWTGSNGYHTAPSIQPVLQFSIDGLKDCDKLILDYLQRPSSSERERGVHISELSQQLKIPEKKITDSIASLENEGLVYSTIDEFHYKFARG